MKLLRYFSIAFFMIFICNSTTLGYTVRLEHPRLYLTQDNIAGIRNKIQTLYQTEFQDFLEEADVKYSYTNDQFRYFYTSIQNYAFLYQMGDSLLSQFTAQHTAQEYGQKAKEMMVSIVTEVLNDGRSLNESSAATTPNTFGYGVSVGYDWLYNLLSEDEKINIVQALSKTITDSDNYTTPLGHAAGKGSQRIFVFALTFYGDGYNDAFAQETLDKFYTRMLGGGTITVLDMLATDDGGTNSGHAYSNYYVRDLGFICDAWRTATDENIFETSTYFRYWPYWLLYTIRPLGPPWIFYHDHHQYSNTATPHHAYTIQVAQSFYKTFDPDRAGLAQWLINNRNMVYPWGWEGNLYPHFIFGDRSVIPKSPAELNLPLTKYFEGLGFVVIRQGFEDVDDTMITFKAMPWAYGGYWTAYNQGSFEIEKYGTLTIHGGSGAHHGYEVSTVSSNTMIFVDSATLDDAGSQRNRQAGYSSASELVPGSEWDVGGIKRYESIDNEYDYIYADLTRAYNSINVTDSGEAPKIDLYSRQFIYFKPPSKHYSDYIIVLDRANTLDPSYEKRWLLHMSYEPEINGQGIEEREGKWVYDNADLVTITNNYGSAHGRLFSKTLLPENYQMVKIGGLQHEFEFVDGTNDGYKWPNGLTPEEAFYSGSYRTEVVTSGQDYDVFLHVLQTADANVTISMAPVLRVDGDTMVGVYINDQETLTDKVAMFSKTEANQAQASYSISSSQTVRHLVADLHPFASYEIYQDESLIDTIGTEEAGTIYFISPSGGNFEIRGMHIPPTVEISAEPTSGPVSLTVQFTATAEDSDGTIDSYSWNFGDGNSSTEQNPTHTYTNTGTFTASLTVTDDEGFQTSDIINITVEIVTDSTPPTIPSGLSGTVQSDTSINLTWQTASDPETGIASYKVYRDGTLITTIQQTSYTDTGLTEKTIYLYQVSAVNGSGLEGEKSESLNIIIDVTPPTIPSGLSGTAQSEYSINLTWQTASDPETGVDSYRVYRDRTLITTIQQTGYTDIGLTENTAYSYQVSAVNGSGLESEKSEAQNITTQADTTSPTIVNVSANSATQVRVVFSESVDQITATNTANYTIDQEITVFSVSLSSDQTTATLITSDLTDRITYTLTVNNITDQASQHNTIAPNTTEQFTFRRTNLIAHWKFDEDIGTQATDSSGNENHGTIHGATWTEGKISGALSFDGSDNTIAMPQVDSLKPTEGVAVALWIKPTADQHMSKAVCWDGGSPNAYAIIVKVGGSSSLTGYYGSVNTDAGNIEAFYNFSPEQVYYHVALVYDGVSGELILYVNGEQKATASGGSTINYTPWGSQRLDIGSDGGNGSFFQGIIDDVHIYNGALSTEQIQELYGGIPGKPGKPIHIDD